MKKLGYIIALFLLLTCSAALALVVKEPGEFTLDKNTTVIVTIREIAAVGPFFDFQLRRKNPGGVDRSTDSFFTGTPADETMIFYWDDARKMLWLGTRKFVCSLPEAAVEKAKSFTDHPATKSPTTWDTTGAWLHWDAKQMPSGGVPEAFLKQARETLKP